MKRITVLLSALLISSAVLAQDMTESATAERNEYKQNQAMFSLELGFDPASIFNASNPGATFNLQNLGIRLRKFKSNTSAFRLGFSIDVGNYVTITQQDPVLKNKLTFFGVWVRPGMEKHFKGTDRLSPYLGYEAIIGFQTSTFVGEVANGENKVKNGQFDDGFTFGIGGIAGFDYYIVKNLYLGLELNYSVVYFSEFKEKTTLSDGTETTTGGGSTLEFTPSAYGSFRIGFLF